MKRLISYLFGLTGLIALQIPAAVAQNGGADGKTETGIASFYHDMFEGRKTANGEIFRQDKFTAAHKSLPLGTWVKVTNLSNDSTVVVRINDRMPLWNKRSIDLTEAAAEQLNYITKGLTKVLIEIIPDPFKKHPTRPVDLPLTRMHVVQLEQFDDVLPRITIRQPMLTFDGVAYAESVMVKKKRR
jgi:rare lipoprotein A